MRVGALYAILRLETGAFHGALGAAESRWARFGGLMKAGGLIAAQAFLVIGAASLKFAADFEQHMNESLAIMGDVSAGMRAQMEEAARAIAKVTTFSATEAADAFFYLAGAGYTAEQSVAALPVVAKFAQAGMMDLERATEMLMNAQMSMNLRTDDATQNMINMTRVSDVLTAAQVESTATLEQMTEALLNKAAPALRVVNKDIEEGAAVLMVFANQGLKGQAAGTGLAIVLRELQTKAIANADAWKELGVAAYDSEGNMRHMADIIGDLERVMEGLTDEQKRVVLGQLGFTDRSMGFIQAMLGNADAIREYDTMLRQASGTTEEIAEKQLDTFQAQLKMTWHKIQDVAISIGQKLLPEAKEIVKWFGNWIDANHDLIVSLVVGVVGAIGTAISFIGDMIGRVSDIVGKIGEARDELGQFGELIGSIFSQNGEHLDGLRKYMDQFDLLDDKMVEVTETMLATIRPAFDRVRDAVVPVADAVASLVSNFDQFIDLTSSVFSSDGAALNGVREYMDAFSELDPVVVEVMETIGTKVSETFTFLAEEVFPPLQESIGVLIEDYIKYLGAQWTWLTDEVIPRLGALLQTVADENLPMLGDAFNWITETVIPALDAAFMFFINEVLPLFQDALNGVIEWFTENWPLISEIAGRVFGAVAALLEVFGNVVATVIGVAWAILEPVATVLFPLIGSAATTMLEGLNGVFWAIGILWDQFAKAASIIAKAVKGAFEGLVGFFQGLWRDITREFRNALNIFVDIINGFLRILNNLRVGIPPIVLPVVGQVFGGATIDPFNIGLIPRLWKGTQSFGGGMAIIGEQGPELAYMPAGAGVLSNRDLMAAIGGGGGDTHYHRHFEPVINVDGAMKDVEDRDDLIEVLQDLSRLEE
jgi:TP901 family phage tail tape measure protein